MLGLSISPPPSMFLQAHKFVGVGNPQARTIIQEIKVAKSPEEAAIIGRTRQKVFPELVCLNIVLSLNLGMKGNLEIFLVRDILERGVYVSNIQQIHLSFKSLLIENR